MDDVPYSARMGMSIVQCLWQSNDHDGVEACRVAKEAPWTHILSETRLGVTPLASSQGRLDSKRALLLVPSILEVMVEYS